MTILWFTSPHGGGGHLGTARAGIRKASGANDPSRPKYWAMRRAKHRKRSTLGEASLCRLNLPRIGNGLWDIAAWCRQHPRSGLYLRQIDLPGIHTKFIEAHRGTLVELLDLAPPAEAINRTASGASRFDARYGFREKPARIRFRILDEANMRAWPGGDITMKAETFASQAPLASRVFITENEINFLAFPPVNDAVIIFGAGYGLKFLQQANWLKIGFN